MTNEQVIQKFLEGERKKEAHRCETSTNKLQKGERYKLWNVINIQH